MSEELNEVDLIKSVFSNQNGGKLMELWQQVYGNRRSFSPGQTPEVTAFFEGQRDFYLFILNTLEDNK